MSQRPTSANVDIHNGIKSLDSSIVVRFDMRRGRIAIDFRKYLEFAITTRTGARHSTLSSPRPWTRSVASSPMRRHKCLAALRPHTQPGVPINSASDGSPTPSATITSNGAQAAIPKGEDRAEGKGPRRRPSQQYGHRPSFAEIPRITTKPPYKMHLSLHAAIPEGEYWAEGKYPQRRSS